MLGICTRGLSRRAQILTLPALKPDTALNWLEKMELGLLLRLPWPSLSISTHHKYRQHSQTRAACYSLVAAYRDKAEEQVCSVLLRSCSSIIAEFS